ncbi:nuclear transport factor 2 family protein [Novosphingobium sp. FGD1]|uniref:Nuclear transport factor 2 family protein n=1 Tax=Novosphingobium silvae TaxID=2692619 RepID=A0A7X4GIN9_9SPHN|nr:nuclear transport factor 2 family protein [Novosphingobium silvae]
MDGVLGDLLSRATLGDLLAQYANLLDWLDWERLDAVFWPEALFDFGMFKGDFAAYRTFVAQLEEGYSRRLHMFGIPSITLSGERARIDATSVIVCRTDAPAPGIDDMFWGRYLFDAERRGGEWRLSGLTYVLNLFDHRERQADDRGGPMTFGDGLSPLHPLAARQRR